MSTREKAPTDWLVAVREIQAIVERVGAALAIIVRVGPKDAEVGSIFSPSAPIREIHLALHAAEQQTLDIHQDLVDQGFITELESTEREADPMALPPLEPKPKEHKGH